MCGGRGTRLESSHEKPLQPIAGEAMVDRVRRALAASRVETTYAVVSPNAPETRAHLEGVLPTIETPGEGYVTDLGVALERQEVEPPVLTVAADLPLLEGEVIDRVLEEYERRMGGRGDRGSLTVCVPAALKRQLGVSCETVLESESDDTELAPTGVNVVGNDPQRQMTYLSDDPRLAINVNRPIDVDRAEERCRCE
ncbi:NTP transferase domain-containing protein [Halobacteria archaeon AArc-m2/3/4]|uniref:NTP transferase domain-containing protein n=1 Tax=Natronoglomus mannanivorans TaxID=2979990 RepID=A0ABT2QD91_9EURY|nr:NTP transferase domain-containing protein [Halobacteria archaeon AArc-m2/3/4]